MTDYTGYKGANAVLAAIASNEQWPGSDSFEFIIDLVTRVWNPEIGSAEDVEPRFRVLADCSDTFFWGSGDAEPITDETIEIWLKTIDDLKPYYEELHAEWRAEYDLQSAELKEGYAHWLLSAVTDERGIKIVDGKSWGQSDEFKAIQAKYKAPFPGSLMQTTLFDLYASRVRGERPQGACYSRYPKRTWHLFDAAGPERETGFGNPYKPGDYGRIVE